MELDTEQFSKSSQASCDSDTVPNNVLKLSDRELTSPTKKSKNSLGGGNKKTPRDGGVSRAVVRETIVQIIEQPMLFPLFPRFTRKFLRFKPPGGETKVLELFEGDVVRMASVKDVVEAIVWWVQSNINHEHVLPFGEVLSARFALEIADSWLVNFAPKALTDLPKTVRFKSEQGFCFGRLPFDLLPEAKLEEAPTWAEALSRMSNAEAFAMRLGSLLVERTPRKQALWLWGQSNCGKSSLLESVAEIFQDAYLPCTYSDAMNGFFKFTVVGKRLVCVSECPIAFVTSPESPFKGLTGEDYHLVNRKGKDHFKAKIEAVFVMTSNEMPKIPNDPSLRNRLIVCQLGPFQGEQMDPVSYRERLKAEMQQFLTYAVNLFQNGAKYGVIPHNTGEIEEAISEYEGEAMDFLHKNFVLEEGSHVFVQTVRDLARNQGVILNDRKWGEWTRAWENLGVVKAKKRDGARTIWCFQGVRFRKDTEKAFVLR